MTALGVADFALAQEVQADLLPGERVLWVGRPVPGRLLSLADFFMVPFSIMWLGFALFWEGTVLGIQAADARPASGFFVLWGIPFVLMGLYLVFGRFVYKAWRKARTLYAVTDRRVVCVTSTFGRRVQANFLHTLPGITTSIGRDGVGSITFGSGGVGGWYANSGLEGFTRRYGPMPLTFYDVADAASVAALINEHSDARG